MNERERDIMSCSFFEMFGNDKNILILQIFQKKGGIHMNIIHTGDWHLGKTIEGHSRLPEQPEISMILSIHQQPQNSFFTQP